MGTPTSAMREVMTAIYFPDGTWVGTPENRRWASDLARWLPGCEPGHLAASELNPVLYSETP
jgi:hypothetical protein